VSLLQVYGALDWVATSRQGTDDLMMDDVVILWVILV